MAYKSGFVAIMGSPNVGKSTLLNELVGMKIAIVSKKAQTTRNKVVGILTTAECQIIFLDTPGLHKPNNKLGRYMVDTANTAQKDADVTLMLIDPVIGILERDSETVSRLNSDSFIAVINKADIVSPDVIDALKRKLLLLGVEERRICVISAIKGEGINELKTLLIGKLEEGPQYYPEDMVTDRPEKFIAAEFIREKILENLEDEVPHGTGIEIEKIEEYENLTKVFAVIYCERESHKRIIIGAKGAMLKKIGTEARRDLQVLFGTKVYLELWVKVKDDWRNSQFMLKELGYSKKSR